MILVRVEQKLQFTDYNEEFIHKDSGENSLDNTIQEEVSSFAVSDICSTELNYILHFRLYLAVRNTLSTRHSRRLNDGYCILKYTNNH